MKKKNKIIQAPLVSVILVNYNGKKFLSNCLESIFNNNYKNYEVIVVDNKSIDGSIKEIEEKYENRKNLRIIRNIANTGPAGGLNLGTCNANGKYLAILGYDVEVDKNWLSTYVEFIEENKQVGIAQGKIMRMEEKDRFSYAGDFLGPFGFLIERARSAKDVRQFEEVVEIFSINSASMIIRRDLFEKLGGFDDRFFMYLEEADLCFRGHLVGKKVVYFPRSIIYHHDSTKVKSKQDFQENMRNYHGCRNYIWMLIKNLGWKNLIIMLPIHVLSWIIIGFLLLIKGEFVRARVIFLALGWHVVHIRTTIKSRWLVQKNIRKVEDENFAHLWQRKKINYYLGKAWAYVNKQPF